MCFTGPAWASARQLGEQTAVTDDVQTQVGAPDRVSVFVYFEANADREPARRFVENNGAAVKYEYKVALPNAINIRNLPFPAMAALEQQPGVVRVERDWYHPDLIKLDESTPRIRALQSQITGAGLSADGAGIRVCVADTGIDMDHAMYSDRIDTGASYDFVNNDSNPDDDHGHGAHVAGIAVGRTGLTVNFEPPVCDGDEPFQGVAPAATLIGAKILNQNGGGSDSDIVAGIDHCADQSPSGGRADVINLSIGTGNYAGTCNSHVWAVAVNNAVNNGVVVVAASGNEGNSNSMGSPACASGSIAVGATYKADYPRCEDTQSSFQWCLDWLCFNSCTDNSPPADDLVCFSNQSDLLDVTAPGAVIWSASTASGGGQITTMSGTSQACPHVAGLAALILSVDPSLTPTEVRQIIRDGAVDLGPTGFDRGYGYGRIDAINSLELVDGCTSDPDCDDGLYCNGEETCNLGSGQCEAGSDPCPGQGCDEANDVCVPLVCNDNGTCDLGEDCNNCPGDCFSGTGASCGNGICETANGEDCFSCPDDCRGKTTGNSKNRYCCGSDVDCSDSRCTEAPYQCTSVPAVASCCGNLICEGTEDVANCAVDCSCTVPADCNDGVSCTDDDCVGGACVHTPNDAYCPDNGLFCDGTERCDAADDCTSTGDPCLPTESCNEVTDTCDPSSCLPRGEPCDPANDQCCNSCHPVKLTCK
jgi:subtilisin family serine protease